MRLKVTSTLIMIEIMLPGGQISPAININKPQKVKTQTLYKT